MEHPFRTDGIGLRPSIAATKSRGAWTPMTALWTGAIRATPTITSGVSYRLRIMAAGRLKCVLRIINILARLTVQRILPAEWATPARERTSPAPAKAATSGKMALVKKVVTIPVRWGIFCIPTVLAVRAR